MAKPCAAVGCETSRVAKGYCLNHYKMWRRRGTTEPVTAEQRFFAKVTDGADGCWEWNRTDRAGYGEPFFDDNVRWLPHRWAYSFLRGEIPEGLELDHLCRNRGCVNPWHLEPVTRSENARRTYQEAVHHRALIGL